MGHVEESRAELGHGADDGVHHLEVDVVLDEHEVADAVRRVDAARSVSDNEPLGAELVHHVNREGDLLRGVALVGMQPALHADDVFAFELAEHEASLVTLGSRGDHEGDIGVRDHRDFINGGGKLSHAASENDGDLRFEAGGMLFNRARCLGDVLFRDQVFHMVSPNGVYPIARA